MQLLQIESPAIQTSTWTILGIRCDMEDGFIDAALANGLIQTLIGHLQNGTFLVKKAGLEAFCLAALRAGVSVKKAHLLVPRVLEEMIEVLTVMEEGEFVDLAKRTIADLYRVAETRSVVSLMIEAAFEDEILDGAFGCD
jgi:hypothetical protein